MHEDLNALCKQLEGAQGAQNAAFCEARGGAVLRLPGGLGVYYGPGHFMNQGLALGLAGELAGEDLGRLEAHLAPSGGEVVLELAPAVADGLPGLLTARGYRLRQFQQVWHRGLTHRPEVSPGDLREARPGDPFAEVVMAGFCATDDFHTVDASAVAMPQPVAGTAAFLAWIGGEPAGGGSVSVFEGVAILSGTSVLPRFRGQGLQKALIAARLAWAHDRGAREACSVTLPGTASQASLERMGFRTAYPKVELVKD